MGNETDAAKIWQEGPQRARHPLDVILLGDSITQGLGSKKMNFTQDLQDGLGDFYRVKNFALTGTTIDYAVELVQKGGIDDCGGICVILYGNVDAQIRPNSKGKVFRRIPVRFQKSGMLMPRPFYSRSMLKRAGQHFDNVCRSFFSWMIKAIDSTEQWVSLSDFALLYECLVVELLSRGFCVVCCSCVFIDERLFPGTPEQFGLFNDEISRIAEVRGCEYLDLYAALREVQSRCGWDACYNKDHFHPNAEGYRMISRLLQEEIMLLAEREGDGHPGAGDDVLSSAAGGEE